MNKILQVILCWIVPTFLIVFSYACGIIAIIIPSMVISSYEVHHPIKYSCNVKEFTQCFEYYVICYDNGIPVNITAAPSQCFTVVIEKDTFEKDDCDLVSGNQIGMVNITLVTDTNITFIIQQQIWNPFTHVTDCWQSYDDSWAINYSKAICIYDTGFQSLKSPATDCGVGLEYIASVVALVLGSLWLIWVIANTIGVYLSLPRKTNKVENSLPSNNSDNSNNSDFTNHNLP